MSFHQRRSINGESSHVNAIGKVQRTTQIYRVLADFLPPDRAELRDRLPTEQSSKALCSSGISELLRLLSRRPCVSSWSKPPAILTASIALSKSEHPFCWDSPRCACLRYNSGHYELIQVNHCHTAATASVTPYQSCNAEQNSTHNQKRFTYPVAVRALLWPEEPAPCAAPATL
jgi:hypothetical protein